MTVGRVRRVAIAAAGAVLACAAASAQPSPAPARPASPRAAIVIDDFARGAANWRRSASIARVQRVGGDPLLSLAGGSISRRLPPRSTLSFDLRLSRGAVVRLGLGAAGMLELREQRNRLVSGGTVLHRSAAPGGWYRVEAAPTGAVALDAQRVRTQRRTAGARVAIDVLRGGASMRAFIASPQRNRAGLLLERLAWLHTRTPLGKQPVGTGLDGRLRFSRSWTRGFWPGSLWQAYDLTRSAMFERWARRATIANFGAEHADTHDLGFMYELSSAAAYDHLCRKAPAGGDCRAFRRSAVTAANSLIKLAATNQRGGTIPTRAGLCTGCRSRDEADTIVDSVMNLPLLYWASRVTGDPRYRDLAARHVHIVASRMVRPDGSTWASMHTRRSDGAFIRFHTHQGYRNDSTWARGQAWAVYGFALAAQSLRDTGLLETAERTTRYVMTRMPRPAVPRYDYDAPRSAPRDVSAAVITAAGMLRLADACEALAATCSPTPAAVRSYAHGLMAAALRGIGTRPPLGFLGHQVYGLGGRTRWDDDAELIFGLNYALEAVNGGA